MRKQQVPSHTPSSSSRLAKQGSSALALVSEEGNKTSDNKNANATRRTSLLSPASEAEAACKCGRASDDCSWACTCTCSSDWRTRHDYTTAWRARYRRACPDSKKTADRKPAGTAGLICATKQCCNYHSQCAATNAGTRQPVDANTDRASSVCGWKRDEVLNSSASAKTEPARRSADGEQRHYCSSNWAASAPNDGRVMGEFQPTWHRYGSVAPIEACCHTNLQRRQARLRHMEGVVRCVH